MRRQKLCDTAEVLLLSVSLSLSLSANHYAATTPQLVNAIALVMLLSQFNCPNFFISAFPSFFCFLLNIYEVRWRCLRKLSILSFMTTSVAGSASFVGCRCVSVPKS
jgi:hypothetical protein